MIKADMASEQVNNESESTLATNNDVVTEETTTSETAETSKVEPTYAETLSELPTEENWEHYHRKAAETGPRSKPIEPYRNAHKERHLP